MGHSTSTPPAEGAPAPPRTQHGLIFDMEDDVRDVRALSSAMVLMIGGNDAVALDRDDIQAALDCVAYLIHERASSLVRGWETAFEAGKGGVA